MKLESCPFCQKSISWYKNDINQIVGVKCRSCGAAFIFFKDGINDIAGDKKKIAEKFNRRKKELFLRQ